LITNQVVGYPKLKRVAALARRAVVGVCVDDAPNARALSQAAVAAQALVHVYVEINAGANRCGVEPGLPALELARIVAALPALRLMGLQAYHGSAQHFRTESERSAAIASAIDKARASRDLMVSAGLDCSVITGAGTGTYAHEAASGVFNELQPGSYAFMDADYRRNHTAQPFEQSLFILTTVMSRSAEHAVVDCGLKAHSVDSGMALVAADARGAPLNGLDYVKASDEHGVIVQHATLPPGALPPVPAAALSPLPPLPRLAPLPSLGEKLRLIPGHIDPTVNLHDWIIAVREGIVEEIWPVTARGAMW
jgi:3-hydroxy-D-aspartate aldolase